MFGPGTFFGIEIGRRALQAETRSMDVVGHNLANEGTDGYTRQAAVHTTTDPYCYPVLNQKVTAGQLGTGVQISYIRRFRDQYLDNQWREVASAVGYWGGVSSTLQKVEILFQEPDDEYGIQALIGNFFDTWSDLNNTPQDTGVKQAVVEAGTVLANAFRQTYAQVNNVRENTDSIIDDTVGRVNEITRQITEVTKEIARVLFVGQQPNDLLDKRDLLLDELASLGEVTVKNKDEGWIEVTFYDKKIVEFDNTKADITRAEAEGWAAAQSETGKLVGYIDALNKIDEYMDTMNQLVIGIADAVNQLHTTGNAEIVSSAPLNVTTGDIVDGSQMVLDIDGVSYTVVFSGVSGNSDVVNQINAVLGTNGLAYLDDTGGLAIRSGAAAGSTITITNIDSVVGAALSMANNQSATSDSGYPLFFNTADPTDPAKEGAAYFYVNQAVIDSALLVNAVDAKDIFNLRLAGTMENGATTFESYYRALTTGIGANVQGAEDRWGTQSLVMLQVDQMRESLIGVNEDEELTMMLQFNRSYQASSRMITVMDGLLDTLINRMAV